MSDGGRRVQVEGVEVPTDHFIDGRRVEMVFCHWPHDVNTDHAAAARISLVAARRVPRVLLYRSNRYAAGVPFNPVHFFDISATIDVKRRALACHAGEIRNRGAAWAGTFIQENALHGAAISLERVLRLPQKVKKTPLRRAVGRFFAFHYICLGWIFFRSGRLSTAGAVLGQIFSHFKAALLPQFVRGYPLVFGLIILGFSIHWLPRGLKYSVKRLTVEASWPVQAFLLAAMIWLVFQFRAADIQPFIYFRF